ncbi:MAG TPA: hypothetical protein DCG78_06000 [Anaerolineaceae bacterium]|nr:hypothetical protein [Anaerolineaceae bacterium]
MNALDVILGLIGFALTLMVFSYLLGDNFFFRAALYLLVGVSSGYIAAVLISKVILPLLIAPIQEAGGQIDLLMFVPLLLCLLLVLMLFPRTGTVGRLPLAFLVGVMAALTIAGVSRGTVAPQLLSIVNRFSPSLIQTGGQLAWGEILEAVFILLGVIAVLFTFHHRTQLKGDIEARSGWVESLSHVGQVFIGITFGMLFVGFYTTALTALIAQLSTLKDFILSLLTG